MNILADESVDRCVIDRLRADGHQVAAIAEDCPSSDDDVVLARALAGGAVLLTLDKDFGELVFLHRLPHAGVVLLRMAELSDAALCDRASAVFRDHAAESPGAFTVVTAEALRTRTMP